MNRRKGQWRPGLAPQMPHVPHFTDTSLIQTHLIFFLHFSFTFFQFSNFATRLQTPFFHVVFLFQFSYLSPFRLSGCRFFLLVFVSKGLRLAPYIQFRVFRRQMSSFLEQNQPSASIMRLYLQRARARISGKIAAGYHGLRDCSRIISDSCSPSTSACQTHNLDDNACNAYQIPSYH